MNKRVVVSMAVGLLAMAIVYLGVENSLREHSFNRFPISSETAISVIMKELNATEANPNDLSTRFVYIKGDGTVYASDVNLNAIGKYLYTSEPAVTTGSHFA